MESPIQQATKLGKVIDIEYARMRLAIVWFGGSGLIFLILIIQSVLGKYYGRVQDVWSWALPTLLPTLSLIITVLGKTSFETEKQSAKLRKSFYLISLYLSVIYLFLILFDLFVEPFTQYAPLELLKLSSLWLAPLQGLTVSSIGALFFTKETEDAPDKEPDATTPRAE